MNALVDAILDVGGAAVAGPYLCALFQGAVTRGLINAEQDGDTAVRLRSFADQPAKDLTDVWAETFWYAGRRREKQTCCGAQSRHEMKTHQYLKSETSSLTGENTRYK